MSFEGVTKEDNLVVVKYRGAGDLCLLRVSQRHKV